MTQSRSLLTLSYRVGGLKIDLLLFLFSELIEGFGHHVVLEVDDVLGECAECLGVVDPIGLLAEYDHVLRVLPDLERVLKHVEQERDKSLFVARKTGPVFLCLSVDLQSHAKAVSESVSVLNGDDFGDVHQGAL